MPEEYVLYLLDSVSYDFNDLALLIEEFIKTGSIEESLMYWTDKEDLFLMECKNKNCP